MVSHAYNARMDASSPGDAETPPWLPAAEQAYRRLRASILAGEFERGERVSELTASARLGMSRTPIREALRRLQSDGLVMPSGRGVVIASLLPSQMLDTYRVRAVLEGLTAELAAARQTKGEIAPSEFAALRGIQHEIDECIDRGDAAGAARANIAFHRHIALLADNPVLDEALGRLWDKILISSSSNLTSPSWSALVKEHHEAIVAAVASGDSQRAATLAREHVNCAAEIFRTETNAVGVPA
jgi:DNA-binding GntR family transcriptional regulator